MNLLHSPLIVYFHDMNSQKLLDAIEKIQTDLEQLRELLASISRDRDDFAVFFFQSRRSFRYALEHGTKSGKGIELAVRMSYKEAAAKGFKGDLDQWRNLLQLGP
jgi:hypothetical protein